MYKFFDKEKIITYTNILNLIFVFHIYLSG